MSSASGDQLFNTWFVAVVVALVISLIAAALWDILRRRTWIFVSRVWPGVLREVGLDHQCRVTRVEEEEKQRAVTNSISALSPQIYTDLAKPPDGMFMAKVLLGSSPLVDHWPSNSGTTDYDVEAQTGMNPLYRPLEPGTSNNTMILIAYFRDRTHDVIISRARHVINRNAIGGTSKRWKSSVVLQASLPVDPCVLTEIVELAKDCLHAEHRCTFQLGNWAILYYHAGNVHIHELAEGDVPVNVEARWQDKKAGITMSGLYLTGAQVKVATEQTSVTLRDDGPAAQGPGDLDELFFPTEQVDVPEDDSLIYASKVVQADGISLTVRSEASRILPPWEKPLREFIWDRLQRISLLAKKVIKSLLRIEDQQLPEFQVTSASGQDLEHFELLTEHWKGVSEIELLGTRKEVLHHLHKLLRFEIGECTDPQPSFDLITRASFIEDQYSSKYWQRGLHDLNQVVLFSERHQNMDTLQCSFHFSIRGGIRFLLADFEGAIQDFDLACYLGHGSTILFDRALAKCVLARYSEAMEDVRTALASNRSPNDIQELETCLQQIILHQRLRVRYGSFSHSDQRKPEPIIIPDLLTGDDWCPAPEYDTKSNSCNTNVEVLEDGGCSRHAQLPGDEFKEIRTYDALCLSNVFGTTKRARCDDFMKVASISAGRPNVMPFLSFSTDNQEISLVMELMNEDLFSLMHDYPIKISETALDMILQTVGAMLYLHEKRTLRRDLKSTNILGFNAKNSTWAEPEYIVAKLVDFGLPKVREVQIRLMTFSNLAPIVGDTRWRAPEPRQASDVGSSVGRAVMFSSKADVYSYGMTRYEILTGKLPFESESSSGKELRKTLLIDNCPQLPQHCPPLWKDLINSCWSQDESKRPSFHDICAELSHRKCLLLRSPCNKVDRGKETAAAEEPPPSSRFSLSKLYNISTTSAISPYPNRSTRDDLDTRWAPELRQASDVGSSVESAIRCNFFKAEAYSFGMVCSEILTLPFESEFSNGKELKMKLLIGDRPQLPQHCPPLLKDLIESCWSQDKSKRPSFHDICAELPQIRKYLLLWPCTNLVDTGKEPAAAEEPPSSNEIDQPSSRFSLSKLYNISTTPAVSPTCPNRSTREDLNQEASASGSSTRTR